MLAGDLTAPLMGPQGELTERCLFKLRLPAGRGKSGLPVGMELDGSMGSDRRLLAIGMAMEAHLGPLPPPLV